MKEILKDIFEKSLERCSPSALLESAIRIGDDTITIGSKQWDKEEVTPVYIVAVGKAAQPLAAKLKQQFTVSDNRIICIAPESEKATEDYVIESSHPIPDKKSLNAGRRLVDFIKNIPDNSKVLFAVSGGTSALVCNPAEGITLADIQQVNKLLLESGADIKATNCVRKHLSRIKGGQLLRYFSPDVELINLFISDVPGDDLSIIGSGLTVPDSTTFQEAQQILKRYAMWEKVSERVRTHITKGIDGSAKETVREGEHPIKNHYSHLIGSAGMFVQIVADEAEKHGYEPWVADEAYHQSAEEVADIIDSRIEETGRDTDQASALIFYGESTVNVTGKGKGGRNQELALRGAMKIDGMENAAWLSAGTDGIDGPTDAAGGIVDGRTIDESKKKGLDVYHYLNENDSYHFHEEMGTLLKIGATGNNMMDVVVVLLGD